MNKTLRKAVMKRSEVERKYLKNRTNENRIRQKKQKNFCSNLYKKEQKKYYSNIELKILQIIKSFKPPISNKGVQPSRITLVDKIEEDKTEKNKIGDSSNEIISDNLDKANRLNEYFQNTIKKQELLSTRTTLVQLQLLQETQSILRLKNSKIIQV